VNLTADQLSAWSTTTGSAQRRRSAPTARGLPKRYFGYGLIALVLLLVLAALTLH
jgi:hypothetical protein